MQLSALKLTLIIVASAIGGIAAFIAAGSMFVAYRMSQPGGFTPSDLKPSKHVGVAPAPSEEARFLGATGHYTMDPSPARDTVLDAGPGKLAAVVTSNGKPVKGLRLRLLLNGSVMSQWASTDDEGRYAIDVPYGVYRIDGYELDRARADAVLAGKTTNPRSTYARSTTTVDKDKPGRALALQFVDPVRMTAPFGEIAAGTPVIIKWDAYPNAAKYRLNLAEMQDPQSFRGMRHLFEQGGPTVSETSYDLSANGVTLKNGYSYVVDIAALDGEGITIAESVGFPGRPQFFMAEK